MTSINEDRANLIWNDELEEGIQNNSQSSYDNGNEMPQIHLYRRRWYILALFSLLACHQCLVWNTFGPITPAVQYAYWSDVNPIVAMFANWGTIMFVIFVFPMCWLLEVRGLRTVVVLISFLVACGTALRCVSTDTETFTIMSHLCAILNGISGTAVMAAPPAISALWFSANERVTATSISQVMNNVGNGLSFILGPLLAPDNFNISGKGNGTISRDQVKMEIAHYMYLDAVVGAALFILIVIYFPAKPKLPPTISSASGRINFKEGLCALISNPQVWLATIAYSLSQGIQGTWIGVLDINFQDFINEEQSGMIGFYSVVGQSVIAFFMAIFSDYFKGSLKITILSLQVLASGCYIWLALLCFKQIEFSLIQLYFATILGTSINFSCSPLFFELTAEFAYPVHEGVVGGFLTAIYNFVGIIFLLIFFIPNIGNLWMNYVLVGSTAVTIPLVCLIRERRNRSNIDRGAGDTAPVST